MSTMPNSQIDIQKKRYPLHSNKNIKNWNRKKCRNVREMFNYNFQSFTYIILLPQASYRIAHMLNFFCYSAMNIKRIFFIWIYRKRKCPLHKGKINLFGKKKIASVQIAEKIGQKTYKSKFITTKQNRFVSTCEILFLSCFKMTAKGILFFCWFLLS